MKLAMAALHADPCEQDRVRPEVAPTKKKAVLVTGASGSEDAPARPEDAEHILCGTTLRDVLLGRFGENHSDEAKSALSTSVLFQDPTMRDWAERHLVPDGQEIEVKPTDPPCKLNRSQKRAIAAMLAYPVSLIQGVRDGAVDRLSCANNLTSNP